MNDQENGAAALNKNDSALQGECKITLTLRQEKNFWAKVEKTDAPDGCWVWVGSQDTKGYGTFKVFPRTYRAHRLSYLLHYGAIAEGLFVCHRCDQPSCIRPDHLWLGTNQENMDDMLKKGRYVSGKAKSIDRPPVLNLHNVPVGEKTYNAKLTEHDVRAIHRLYKEERWSQAKLARQFKIGQM